MTDLTAPRALPAVSLCMIVKNEADNLDRCLASVQGVADELIIVDTGSTDHTLAVAQRHGATVFHQAWQDDFSQARNAALAQARGDWILHLDADEALEPGSQQALKAVLAAATAEGLNVCVRNFNPPGVMAAYFDSAQVRLFRNRPAYRYELPIHELIVPSIWRQGGQVGESGLVIWHYGYLVDTVQGQADRLQRNLYLLEQAVAQSPQDAGHCARLGFCYYQLGRQALAYTYLRRALVDLDSHRFTPDFLERVLCTLWDIAVTQQEEGLARHCARALEALRETLTLSVRAAYALAHTYWREGEQGLEAALQATSTWPEALARLEAARQALQQAENYFLQLRQHPQLSPAAVEKTEADRQRCQASLATAAEYAELGRRRQAAVEALRRLVAADDPGRMIEQTPEILNPDVVALARSQAKAARAEARETEAARLEVLAAQLETAWRYAAGQIGQVLE